ncbi:MAG: hypothetical protein JWO81_2794 [Alphaproteobacteria bacterium]|nr:hypothetical protein [Alphaproteobacteria bacterium]
MSRIVLLAAAALAFTASPAAARDSWGKANIGFAEYRLDADQCSNAAFEARLWFGPIEHIARATNAMQTDLFSYARSHDIFVHGVTVTIADQLQNAVDRCLVDRGYRRFHLTGAQERQLARFRKGTMERAHYLHDLAADPVVMTSQALPTVRPPEPPADEGKPRKQPFEIIDFGPRPV